MRLSSALVGLVGATAGVTVGLLGYQTTAAVSSPVGGSTVTAAVPTVGRPLPAAPPQITVRVLRCPGHARLVHGTCVTVVDRTVVVQDIVPAALSTPAGVPRSGVAHRPTRHHRHKHHLTSGDAPPPGDDHQGGSGEPPPPGDD